MTLSRDVTFRIDLGNDLELITAQLIIYAITDEDPVQVEWQTVLQPELTVSLEGYDNPLFYVVAEILGFREKGGEEQERDTQRVQFLALFDADTEEVVLNERQTVANVFCAAPFLQLDGAEVNISDPNQALHLALGMKNNFVRPDGRISHVIPVSPNGLETNSYALFNFLGNLLYYGLVDTSVYDQLLSLTGGDSLLSSLWVMARQPFTEVDAIYGLISDRPQVFTPSLPELKHPAKPVPHQWSLTVKFNDSGAKNFMIAGIGYAMFDKNDRLWLANNVRQGTPNSATFCVVLEPDGSPAPFSPVFGGGLLGAGFGVAVDKEGETIAFNNFGWGPAEQNPQHGSISLFTHKGEAITPSEGWTKGLSRGQGLDYDRHGNLWCTSWGTQDPMPPTTSKYIFKDQPSGVVVYMDGKNERVLTHHFDSPFHLPFDLVVDAEDNCYVSNAGDSKNGIRSSVRKLRIEGDELREVARWESKYISPHAEEKGPEHHGFETLRQITLSPKGDVFVVGVASGRVLKFSQDLELLETFDQEVYGPWGITFDAVGTMYVSNFAQAWDERLQTLVLRDGPYGVTVIRNEDPSTAQFYTVPTGGKDVTLANGLPLYGNAEGAPKSYDPIMRLTGSRIDRAGNLWCCNNWKPSADIDAVQGNPGGDGMVVFVGVAEPTPVRRR